MVLGGGYMKKMICLSLLVFTGCQNSTSVTDSKEVSVNPRVVYGQDDRQDVYQVSAMEWLDRARSTVALINSSKMTADSGGFKIKTTSYATSQSLCKNEPFYDQVTAAFCSGSLIAPDIVMTAGHCVRNLVACQGTQFVFDFSYFSAGLTPSYAKKEDVYSCKELIFSEMNSSTMSDYALIRLDRPVVGRLPLAVRQAGQVSEGDPLVVIGHPSGLPTKIAAGAAVRSTQPAAYFIANLDTYGGNSGSAVFNENTGEIEGILVRGETDFRYKNGCYVTNVCDSNGCRGEDVTRVSETFSHWNP